MMRIAWRTLPFVVLLLASAGTASAECAWVLWRGSGDPLTWEVSDAFDSRERCVEKIARIRKQFSDDNRSTWYHPGGTERVETGVSYRWLPTSPWEHLRCIPGTIDPRGPKGGAR